VPHLLGGGLSQCQPPSMKLIGPPGTELRHILATYIMCPCDLDLWPVSPKIGSRDPEVLLNVPILKLKLKNLILKCRFSVSIARQPALPWQPFCAPLVGGAGSSSC